MPHPKVDLLNPDYVWIPNSEDYGGLCDRHVILSNLNLENYINMFESFVLKSNYYYHKISQRGAWNMEQLLKFHLETNGLIKSVKRFPYIMYLVRGTNDSSRWAMGNWNENEKCFIKYDTEYNSAQHYKNQWRTSNISSSDFYKNIIEK